jgi:hypothetical protein
MLKAYPEAIRWFEKATGKTLVQHYIELFQSIPIHLSSDDAPRDPPAVDDLVKTLHKRMKSTQVKQEALRDFSILIDYGWLTEEMGETDLKAIERLRKKYNTASVHACVTDMARRVKAYH